MAGKADRTREQILDKAQSLFAEKGFKQVTMKDVCQITGMSRGGLYSHFSSTAEIFEALLEKMTSNDAMDFRGMINEGVSAHSILQGALEQIKEEMLSPEDSLSLAMYEYGETVDSKVMAKLNEDANKKWADLIRYGIRRGEFKDVDVEEVVNVILYSYQGVRMWSRVVALKQETVSSICEHIWKTLIGE